MKKRYSVIFLLLAWASSIFALDTVTVTFQQGLDGYDGWEDSYIGIYHNGEKWTNDNFANKDTLDLWSHTYHSS